VIIAIASSDWRKQVALKSMSIEKLRDLKEKIEATIHTKVTERRHELESEMSKLTRFEGGRGGGKLGRGGARGSVAPKYRNPENPTETWAGRGLKPRWLADAIKGGKKQDDFLIAKAKASPSKQPKKTRKIRAKK
jgi:DNA-binding protein H-NS